MRRCWIVTVAALLATSMAAAADEPAPRAVVFVANAEDGTVDIIDATSLTIVRSLNVIPDGSTPDPTIDPLHAVSYPLVVGAAGENWAQDLDVSPDGRTLYVSRGHLGDVAAFDIATGTMIWRAAVGGVRADHMALSADGARLFVSALTVDEVEVFDTASGALLGTFATGSWPHDNELSPDGARVYNGSLGNILLPEEVRDAAGSTIAPTVITVADATTLEVLRTIPVERGIRPFVITEDEATMYAQLSEFHGIVQIDLASGEEVARVELPIDDGVTSDDYDFEAPHHGLAFSGDEQLLCVAGRASDYAALVRADTLEPAAIIDVDDAPGWAATSPDGSACYVASTRADTVTVISYETMSIVAVIPTGNGPKYLESAMLPADVLA